jgi:AcrR family transcriptional regulator
MEESVGAAERTTGVASGGEPSDTRKRLIDAAIDLFLTAGYSNLRVRDITHHAGVGKGTFYLHFADKRDLLVAYFQRVTELVDRFDGEVAAVGPDFFVREGLRLRASLERGVNWNSMVTFLRVSAGSSDPDIVSAVREVHARIADGPKKDLANAIQAGVTREVDTELATSMVAGMIEALAWRGRQDESYDPVAMVAFLEDIVERTLRVDENEDERRARVTAMLQKSEQVERAIEAALPLGLETDETADTRQRLVDAAVDLLHKVGYDNLRVDDITDHAGVGKGTFYHHFKSKEEVLLAFFRRVMDNIGEVQALIAATDLDYLSRVALRMRLALRPQRQWDRIVTFTRVMAGSEDPEIRTGAGEVLGCLAEAQKRDLEEAMRQGLVRQVDPELAITAVLGMEEVLVWRVKQDDAYDSATILAFMADMFCRAFL